MEQYVIKGGRPLEGEVTIAGAKNAALGILAAAVMTDQEVTIENVPNVRDTRVLLQAIQGIGARVRYIDEHTVAICGGTINPNTDLCVDANISERSEHPTICSAHCLANITIHRSLFQADATSEPVR